ncbi:thyroid hormone-induced protein B-like [Branchiostoma floridae x Branchiostoma japonicum]
MLLLVTSLVMALLPCLHAQGFTGKADCTFEKGLCSLKQATDDSWDWERRKGNDRYYKTLPSHDHSLGNGEGYFMAVRSPIVPIVSERSARLETGMLRAGRHCLTFYYRIYYAWGADWYPETMNRLNVYVMSGDQPGEPLWSIKDGDLWREAQVTINSPRDFQIIFEAEVKSEYKGSIALDDISIAGGSCEVSCKDSFYGCCMDGVTAAAGPNYQGCRFEPDDIVEPDEDTKIEQFPGKAGDSADCTFEQDECAWYQAQRDNLDWVRLKGWSRNVQNTLPSSDQTTKKANGWFMTVQSPVRPYIAQVARLQTPEIRSWSGYPEKCLTFHYHMAEKFPDFFPREGTNLLNVFATSKKYYDEPIFVANDVMDDQWKRVSVTFSSEKDFQIVFEAIMLSEYPGDISIDDVTVDEGSCEDRHACKRSRYGCCPDGRTRKQDTAGRGCRYVGRLGADPEGLEQFEEEEKYTIDKVLEDPCTMLLGVEFQDCWTRYKAIIWWLKEEGRDADVGAYCVAHADLYKCYYSAVTTLCEDDRNYRSFKATLGRDVRYIKNFCKNGKRGRRGRARRHSLVPLSPTDLMDMLP